MIPPKQMANASAEVAKNRFGVINPMEELIMETVNLPPAVGTATSLSNILIVDTRGGKENAREFYLIPPIGKDHFSRASLGRFGNLTPPGTTVQFPVTSTSSARYILNVHYPIGESTTTEYFKLLEYLEQLMCTHISRDTKEIQRSTFLTKIYKSAATKPGAVATHFAQELFAQRNKIIKHVKDYKSTEIIKPDLPDSAYVSYKQRVFMRSGTKSKKPMPDWVQKIIDDEVSKASTKGRVAKPKIHYELPFYTFDPSSPLCHSPNPLVIDEEKPTSVGDLLTCTTAFRPVIYAGGLVLSPAMLNVLKLVSDAPAVPAK